MNKKERIELLLSMHLHDLENSEILLTANPDEIKRAIKILEKDGKKTKRIELLKKELRLREPSKKDFTNLKADQKKFISEWNNIRKAVQKIKDNGKLIKETY